jgi:hypothetical protein
MLRSIIVFCIATGAAAVPRTLAQEGGPARFTGSPSCMSSSCHGGGTGKNQGLIFAKKDVHTRGVALLSNTRSQRIAEVLQIPDAARSQRCLVCHSPLQTVPPQRFVKGVLPENGVSCESCHGPAEQWLRFHTRPDATHEQNVSIGLRELRDSYHRSNACVACHLNLDPELRRAGHPEMFFELDGQMAAEPPHWKNTPGAWGGPAAWLTGQAVALRELSWKLGTGTDTELAPRWRALVWLLRKTEAGAVQLPTDTASFTAMQAAADRLARAAAGGTWSRESTLKLLRTYATLSEDFRTSTADPADLRRRGEVLVLALDRLWQPLKRSGMASETLDIALAALNTEARAQAAFQKDRFAAALQQIEVALELMPAN